MEITHLVKVVCHSCNLGVETSSKSGLNVKAKQLGSFYSCSLILIFSCTLLRNNQNHRAIILWLLQLLRRRDLIIQYLQVSRRASAQHWQSSCFTSFRVCANATFSKASSEHPKILSPPTVHISFHCYLFDLSIILYTLPVYFDYFLQ